MPRLTPSLPDGRTAPVRIIYARTSRTGASRSASASAAGSTSATSGGRRSSSSSRSSRRGFSSARSRVLPALPRLSRDGLRARDKDVPTLECSVKVSFSPLQMIEGYQATFSNTPMLLYRVARKARDRQTRFVGQWMDCRAVDGHSALRSSKSFTAPAGSENLKEGCR